MNFLNFNLVSLTKYQPILRVPRKSENYLLINLVTIPYIKGVVCRQVGIIRTHTGNQHCLQTYLRALLKF